MSEKNAFRKQPWIDALFQEAKTARERLQINSPEDLADALIGFIPLLNSNPTLASLFVADIDSFMEDMGIELNDEMRGHLKGNVSLYKYNDPKMYEAIKSGKRLSGLKNLRLSPSKKLLRKANIVKQIRALKEGKKVISSATRTLPQNIVNRSTSRAPDASVLFSTTRGWTVILQIAQAYMSDLFEDIMETQYNSAALAALLTGEREFDGIAEPWHQYDFWFLLPMHLRFTVEYINIENEPSMSLQGTGPRHVNVTFKINGELTVDGSNGPQTTAFTGTATQEGTIVRREPERDYILDFQSAWPLVVLEGDDPGILPELVALGILDYFRREIPTMPLFSLPDTPPFIFFESSDLVSVDGAGNQNALTWAYGTGPNRVNPFDRYIILPGNNMTIGNAASAIQFRIREGLPEVPLISEDDENLMIRSIDVELRDGHIEVTGRGVYHTCWCYPDVDFDYSVKIRLSIDDDGNLVGTVDDPEVDLSGWLYFLHALIVGAIGFIIAGPGGLAVGAGLGAIGTAIAESMFGSDVADAIEDQLNIDMNVEQQLNDGLSSLAQASAGWIAITAQIRTVQITPNGLFFHGNLTTDAVLSTR